MIAIVISACLVGDPHVCKDYRIPLAIEVDANHCMTDAQPHFATWAEQPPGLADHALALHHRRRRGPLRSTDSLREPKETAMRRGLIRARRSRPHCCSPLPARSTRRT